jgi:hypothetical protein
MAKEKNDPESDQQTQNNQLAEALLAAMAKMAPQGGGLSKDDLKEVMQSNAEGMRKALKPENARHEDISAFNPLGERDHPRPKLIRKTFWAGTELHEDELTAEEISLFNSFAHSTEARNGSWTAELRRTGKLGESQLHITFPCRSTDDRMDLPNGMNLMLRELLGGAQAVDPSSLSARVAELEAKLAAQ